MAEIKDFAGEYTLRKRNRDKEESAMQQKNQETPRWSVAGLKAGKSNLCGPTVCNWLKIILYYFLIFVFVVAFTVGYYYLYSSYFIPKGEPKYLNDQPGLSFTPKDISSVELYFDVPLNINPIKKHIGTFLEISENHDMSRFDECNSDGFYGYVTQQPCVFIKLNRIAKFKPMTYDTLGSLPKNAPEKLKTLMKEYGEGDRIWLLCENVNDGGVVPNISYVPYPYWLADSIMDNEPQFLTRNDNKTLIVPAKHKRIIGIKLNDFPLDIKVSTTCTVWAKNIEVNKNEPGTGWVSFDIKIKKSKTIKEFENPEDSDDFIEPKND